jgi:hypothetical protein
MQSNLLPDVLLHAETRDRVTAVRPLHNRSMQWTMPASKLFDVPEPARPLIGITLDVAQTHVVPSHTELPSRCPICRCPARSGTLAPTLEA